MADATAMEKLVSLCKRRGFIFPGSEIYGGLQGTWDYGPLGVELLRNVKNAWWHDNITSRDDIVGLDAAILMHRTVWQASGHESNFTDPLVDCKTCKARFRQDQIAESQCPKKPSKKPGEFSECQLTEARKFNLMFKTFVGPVEENATQVYLRPETAQGIFVNFKNVCDSSRMKVPFGIAQVGKSFRNEITPKQFIFRSREFEQMEIEFFCKPETSQQWYATWRDARFQWYKDLGLKSDNLRLREHDKEELAFYSVGTSDVEYKFPWGWGELEGIAHRGDYDLKQHMQFSGKDLSYFDDETKERFVPHVIEPSAGATRSVLAFLCEAYAEEMVEGESRTVLRFHPRLAPVKAAIFPLVKKDGMPERATSLYKDLQKNFNVFYDEKGAVGRRYRRQDEAGTPFCLTIDGQTAQDQTVTVRERDSMKQERISVDKVKNYLFEKLGGGSTL
ncbi:MAG TPA: glycine--tRNA ligase [Tepidisphaeraceae bacterium]|nr:glycine--tRNA ligase [Tepidisphaeraceae bacterium]